MQNSQEINWYLILAPSLIVGLSAVIVQILLAYWLSKVSENYKKDISKEIEDYKKELNKELENHKMQLQADFQTKLSVFQTQFSAIHQEKIKTFMKIYGLVSELDLLLADASKFQPEPVRPNDKDGETRERYLSKIQKKTDLAGEKYNELTQFYYSKKILFDTNIAEIIEKIYFPKVIESLEILQKTKDPLAVYEKNINIITLKNHLEKIFRQLISAENPNLQLEKKQ